MGVDGQTKEAKPSLLQKLAGFFRTPSADLTSAFNEALRLHQSGDCSGAEAIYRRILQSEPGHFGSLYRLGLLASQRGDYAASVLHIDAALKIKPDVAEALNNRGTVLTQLNRLDEALASYEQAITLKADYAEAFYNRGVILQTLGRCEDALTSYNHALGLKPSHAQSLNNSAAILEQLNRADEALANYDKAVALNPKNAQAFNNRGLLLRRLNRLDEALANYDRAIALNPGSAQAFHNRGDILEKLKRMDEALASYDKAIVLKPDDAEAFNSRGILLQELKRLDDALGNYNRAIVLKPDFAEAYNNRAAILQEQGQLGEALASYDQAILLKRDFAEAFSNRGIAFQDQARLDEALASYRRAVEIDPADARIHSKLLFALHYAEPNDPQSIFDEHRNWARRHGVSPLNGAQSVQINKAHNRRLRIGYVSADFWNHSVSYFLEPLLAARDRSGFEIFCYSNSLFGDSTTARLHALADNWRNICNLDDMQVSALIQADAIDILVDLSGHTGGNRLPLFACKPAPIQATYLGYPNTTGIDAIDYRFTDEWADPSGHTEKFHTETLVRLPHGFLCYQPSLSAPEVSPLPMLREGHVTFGSFNNLAKVSPTIIRYWASILLAVPKSRLLLKSKALADTASCEYVRQQFYAHGVDADRIELMGRIADQSSHLSQYGKVDIALDTFPFHGATTTCEALWMGVPVLTLAGPVHVSRVGVSLLHAAGLTEMITESPPEYVQKAVALAEDTSRLTALRSELRERMKTSPLTDARRIAGSIEAAYRDMWQRFC